MRFQLVLNKTFCPNPQPLIQRQLKQRQITKINKTMLFAPSLPPPFSVLATRRSQNQNWKANKYSILTVNELGPPVLESSKVYALTDSEHKFNKAEFENWLPIGHNLGSSWLGTAFITATFHFPEPVPVFPNATTITQSSINPQYNKNQPPLA